VTPSSIVGSVGVRASYPSEGFGRSLTTGPDKDSGGTTAEARARVETIKRAFVGAVMRHRGDRLTVDRREVETAKVYGGARAIEAGFADDVGVLDDALAAAAARAGVEEYRVLHTRIGSGSHFTSVTGDANPYRPVEDDLSGYAGVETTRYLMLWGFVDSPGSTAAGDSSAPGNASAIGEVTPDGAT
jgi:protease-4